MLKFAKDRQRLISLLGIDSTQNFSETYKGWVEETLGRDDHVRETKWSESIAVGAKSFVEKIKEKLGAQAIGRRAVEAADAYELKEPEGTFTSLIWGVKRAF